MLVAVRGARSSRSHSARTRRTFAGALATLALAAAACSTEDSTAPPPSLAKQSALTGAFQLVAVDVSPASYTGTAFSGATVCGGTVMITGATLTLASDGTFALALSLGDGQTYQETGTFKVQANDTITFKSSGQTVQGQLVGGLIYIPSYTYCGESHSLLFAQPSA